MFLWGTVDDLASAGRYLFSCKMCVIIFLPASGVQLCSFSPSCGLTAVSQVPVGRGAAGTQTPTVRIWGPASAPSLPGVPVAGRQWILLELSCPSPPPAELVTAVPQNCGKPTHFLLPFKICHLFVCLVGFQSLSGIGVFVFIVWMANSLQCIYLWDTWFVRTKHKWSLICSFEASDASIILILLPS